MANYSRPASAERFKFDGVKTNSSADSMPPHKYPYAQNVRGYNDSSIQSRPQIVQQVAVPFDGGTTVQAVEPSIGVYKQGSVINLFNNGGVVVDTGYSPSQGCSLRPFRPNASPNAWEYIFDDNKQTKVYVNPSGTLGLLQKTGIAEPQSPPDACVDQFNVFAVGLENAASWTATGTAVGLADGVRFVDVITVAIADPASVSPSLTTRYSLQITTAGQYQMGMKVDLGNAAGGTIPAIVQDVFPAVNNQSSLTIQAIKYFSGTTGRCVIVPTQMPTESSVPTFSQGIPNSESVLAPTFIAGLRRGALVQLSGATETCFVLSVSDGPDGNVCFEVVTVNTHSAGDAIVGLPAIAVSFAQNPALVAGQPISATKITGNIGIGVGFISNTIAAANNPFTHQGFLSDPTLPTPQAEDYIHISVFFDQAGGITEGRILFDVGDGTFQQNYYYKDFRQNDLVPTLANAATQLGGAQLVAQRAIIDAEVAQAANNQFTTMSSLQASGGASQWSELMFPISDLTRVGEDTTLTLANCNAARIQLQVSVNVAFAFDSFWVEAGGKPDVGDTAMPIFYRVRGRNSVTGAVGNHSPVTRYGVSPRRQRVIVSLPSASYDTQIDTWDVERMGGTLTEFKYVGSAPSSATTYVDNFFDDSLLNSAIDSISNYEPFPSIGPPITATSATIIGTLMTAVYPDAASSPSLKGTLSQLGALLPGNEFNIGQQVFTLWKRPTLVTSGGGTQTYLFEFQENAGSQTNPLVLLQEPTLAAQTTNNVFGPDSRGVFFSVEAGSSANGGSVGLRPGLVQWTNANNPDSADEKNTDDISPTSEPLINGEILGTTPCVASSSRWWRGSYGGGKYKFNEIPVGAGLAAEFGICTDGEAIYFVAKDGIRKHAGGPSVSLTDVDLFNLFPHEGIVVPADVTYAGNTIFAPSYKFAANMRLGAVNGFLYFDYLDSSQVQRTLVCNLRNGAWVSDDYSGLARISIHVPSLLPASNFLIPASATINQQLFMGGVDGAIYIEQSSPTPSTGEIVSSIVATREEMFGDIRANKVFGDASLDTLAAGSDMTVTPIFFGSIFGTSTTITGGQSARPSSPPTVNLLGEQIKRSMGLLVSWTDQGTSSFLFSWQPAYLTQPEDISNRFTDWDNAGTENNKFFQGFEIETDTINVAKSLLIRDADSLATHAFTSATGTNQVKANGQQVIACSFNSPFSAHLVRLEPNDSNVWRLWGVKWIHEPTPESALTWQTQGSSFGLDGYLHIKEVLAAIVSSAVVTLTITAFDGLSPNVVTLPNTGGFYQKVLIPLSPNKGLLYTFSAVSSQPFQVFAKDFEVLIKQWGSTGPYQRYKGLGAPHGAGVLV